MPTKKATKKPKKSTRRQLGSDWRLFANGNRGVDGDLQVTDEGLLTSLKEPAKYLFDELVVDGWLHIERMDTNAWWMKLGDANLWIEVDPKTQKVRVNTYDGVITPRGFIVEEKHDDDEKKARA